MTQIILNQPHTHNGVLHAVGAEINVLVHDAEYLVQRGISNFKRGVQKRAVPNTPPASADEAAAGEPAAAPEPAADTTAPTVETGDTHATE